MKGRKVLSSDEMKRVEALAFLQHVKEEDLMKEAGKKSALHAIHCLLSSHLPREVILLAGMGNNGADGFVAAAHLIKQGFSVKAFLVGKMAEASPLCQKEALRFLKMNGAILEIETIEDLVLPEQGLLLDALLGTGFQKEVTGLIKEIIEKVNHARLFVISLDIPSGLDGNTGAVRPVAIRATETVTFSLSKVGFFVNEGWNHLGKLFVEDIGLPEEYIERGSASFFLLDEQALAQDLPPIERSSNKYERGSVVGVAGSLGMEGAAKLSAVAALRSGAGIVKLFLPQNVQVESASFPDELVKRFWKENDWKELREECSKSAAVYLGPGLGRGRQIDHLMQEVLSSISVPSVLDADALFVLSHHPHIALPKKTIITPHHQEMERLLGVKGVKRDLAFLSTCQRYCEEKNVTLVLKGAPTFILHKGEKPIVALRSDPAMATAGSGDVLTGIIVALCAQKLSPYKAALLGVHLHGMCGELAAKEKGPYSVIASDLIDQLPQSFRICEAIK